MTLAAVDRLVHRAKFFEMNVKSYRRRAAVQRKTAAESPRSSATIKIAEHDVPSDNQTAK